MTMQCSQSCSRGVLKYVILHYVFLFHNASETRGPHFINENNLIICFQTRNRSPISDFLNLVLKVELEAEDPAWMEPEEPFLYFKLWYSETQSQVLAMPPPAEPTQNVFITFPKTSLYLFARIRVTVHGLNYLRETHCYVNLDQVNNKCITISLHIE